MKKALVPILTLIMLAGISSVSLAAPTEIGLEDLVLMRFRVSAGGIAPLQRAVITRQRMVAAINNGPLRSQRIGISMMNGNPVIMANGFHIVTITTADARVNSISQAELARVWLRNFQSKLPDYQAWSRYKR